MLTILKKTSKALAKILITCIITTSVLLCYHSGAEAISNITITSPVNGENVNGVIQISGNYSNCYDLQICINAEDIFDCHMVDTNGDDTGTWYYELDTSKYDGTIEIIVRATDTGTRYYVWAPYISINSDNITSNIPTITITNPSDNDSVSGVVPVMVAVNSRNPLFSNPKVRINGGEWRTTTFSGTNYVYNWDTSGIGNKTCSIESTASDIYNNTGISKTVYVKVGTGTNETVSVNCQDQAVWIWEFAGYNLLQNPGARIVLDNFCKDASISSHPINTLFLYADRYNDSFLLRENPELYRNFISWAHENGYKVHALIGSSLYLTPSWAYTRYHDKAVRLMENVINYNISSAADEKFDGVQCDIEPHGLPDWSNSPSVQLQYLNMLDKMICRRNVSGLNLSFGPAIPRWYDINSECSNITWNGSTKWLSQHIQDMCDYIAIMDYRDIATGTKGIIEHAQNEINYANTIGKQDSVVIGVETDDVAVTGDTEVVSFHEEGRDYLKNQLNLVYNQFESSASFCGIAVHHYDTYRWLPTVWANNSIIWNPPADAENPSEISGTPIAAAFDFQRIDLKFGSATDNCDIAKYNIYRSTISGFTPNHTNLVGSTKWNFYKDCGLLPDTTYYYKFAAEDISGNVGPYTTQISATTLNTSLVPMIINDMNITYNGTYATVSLNVANKNNGNGITASVYGHFNYTGGKYINKTTLTDGTLTANSETIGMSNTKIGFMPHRLKANGYYWASAYDNPHTAFYCSPFAGSNMIQNAGFESGSSNWEDWGTSIIISSNVHSGTYAMRVGSNEGGCGQIITSNVYPSTIYTFEAWGKVGNIGEIGYIGVDYLDSSGIKIGQSKLIFHETSYTKKTISFTTPSNCAKLRPFLWIDAGTNSCLYGDDLGLYN